MLETASRQLSQEASFNNYISPRMKGMNVSESITLAGALFGRIIPGSERVYRQSRLVWT